MVDPAAPWPREELTVPARQLAPRLLGGQLRAGRVQLLITEVEAYAGAQDPGSHAYRGLTRRNAVMFGEAGHAYVYLSYGMHRCLNVVCGPEGVANAVLVRAGRLVAGEDLARARRDAGRPRPHPPRDLARGPGRLGAALGIGLDDSGVDLCDPAARLQLWRDEPVAMDRLRTGPRVGVSGAGGDGTAYPWRWWIEGEPSVSVYRPGRASRQGAG